MQISNQLIDTLKEPYLGGAFFFFFLKKFFLGGEKKLPRFKS